MEGEPYNVFIHFMSDELVQNDRTSAGDYYSSQIFGYFTWQRQVGIDVNGTSVGEENGCWNMSYEYINVANMVLDELANVDAANDSEVEDKIRIEGEAHFLRALYYFTLVNLYAPPYVPNTAASTAGIPLKLTSYIEDRPYSCNTVAEVYEQILVDLDRAEECLAQTARKSVYRADITATYLLKSRVYLYMQDYDNARKYAEMVLERNNNLVDLNGYAGSDNVFTSSSPEVIFSMGGHMLTYYIYGDDRYEDEYPFYVSDDLINIFSDDDLRKSSYIQKEPMAIRSKRYIGDVPILGPPVRCRTIFCFAPQRRT